MFRLVDINISLQNETNMPNRDEEDTDDESRHGDAGSYPILSIRSAASGMVTRQWRDVLLWQIWQ